ncbi:DNA-binding protein HU, partial [Oleiphilus sp. HI0009]
TDEVTNAMTRNDPVSLIGFGTFSQRERSARTGKNPQTGKTIQIPASKSVGFKPGKALKDAVN